jgi:hypothetical protein
MTLLRVDDSPRVAVATSFLIVLALGAGLAVASGGAPAFAAVLALGGALLAVRLASRGGLLEPWGVVLVVLLSANYNVLFNLNAFIAEGASRGRMLTPVATAGLALFVVLQNERRSALHVPFRLSPVDGLFAALFALSTVALVRGVYAGNPRVYLIGDYGQLMQMIVAYAAVRMYWLNAGNEGMRAFLCLLAASWGLRSAVELAFPEARGTAVIVLEGETLFRRADPLGPIAIPLLMGLLFSERNGDRRLLLSGSLALIVAQNLLGFTRAHYLALGVAVPVLMLVAVRRPQVRGTALHAVLIGALVAGGLYVVVSPVRGEVDRAWGRFLETFDSTTGSRLHREAESAALLNYVRSAPFTGYGLGFEYEGADPETLRGKTVHFVHDDYLALWLRGGVLLAGVWIAILGYSIWGGFLRLSDLGPLVSAGAAAGVLAEAITAVFSGSAFGYVAGPVMALAIAVATCRPDEEMAREAGRRRPAALARHAEPA